MTTRPSKSLWLIAVVTLQLANISVAGVNDQFRFPANQTDLGEDKFFYTNYFHAMPGPGDADNAGSTGSAADMSVIKFNDDTNQYERCPNDGTCTKGVGNPNSDSYAFDKPLYSPISGYVIACAKSYPENPSIGESNPGRLSTPVTIATGGNHLFIRNPRSNKAYFLGHLKANTIPSSICPNTTMDEDLVNPFGGMYVQTFIPPDQRPWVEIGQHIGNVGSTGASGSPHTHVQVDEYMTPNGDEFGEAWFGRNSWPRYLYSFMTPFSWSQQISVFDWSPMYGIVEIGNTPGASDTVAFYASPLLRVATGVQEGSFSNFDIVYLRPDTIVSAKVRNSDKKYFLTSWKNEISSTSLTVLKYDQNEGYARKVRLARVDNERVLLATEDYAHNLRLKLYHVDDNGSFDVLDFKVAGSIDMLELTRVKSTSGHFVTAVRTGNGNLKLIAWTVTDNDEIERKGQYTTGDVADLDVTAMSDYTIGTDIGVVVAVQLQDTDQLRVIPFKMNSDASTFTRGDDYTATFDVGQVSITNIPEGVVVGAKDDNGNLKVSSYAISNGDIVKESSVKSAGAIHHVVMDKTPGSGSDVIATVRTGSGDLKAITWMMKPNGEQMYRGDGTKGGEVNGIATSSLRIWDGVRLEDQFVIAVKDSGNDLRVIRYRVNLEGSIQFSNQPLSTGKPNKGT